MKMHLVPLVVLILFGLGYGISLPPANQSQPDVAKQIIAREKASFEAWQRKDKAFYADYWADDFTEFLPDNPYLDTSAKENLLPKMMQKFEQWKIVDFQMYNPRVQLYGEVAILTYTEAVTGISNGQPSSYTGKVTMVYVKQDGTWRGVHYHESANPKTP